jgi:hypothetical protein
MPDFKITIIVKDVAKGDVEPLVDEIEQRGDDFDARRGDFVVETSQFIDGSWFPVDLSGEDES